MAGACFHPDTGAEHLVLDMPRRWAHWIGPPFSDRLRSEASQGAKMKGRATRAGSFFILGSAGETRQASPGRAPSPGRGMPAQPRRSCAPHEPQIEPMAADGGGLTLTDLSHPHSLPGKCWEQVRMIDCMRWAAYDSDGGLFFSEKTSDRHDIFTYFFSCSCS